MNAQEVIIWAKSIIDDPHVDNDDWIMARGILDTERKIEERNDIAHKKSPSEKQITF